MDKIPNLSYGQIYQQFNNSELTSRTTFELLYKKCLELEALKQKLVSENQSLIREKIEYSKILSTKKVKKKGKK